MPYYNICPYCGAHLDPGERCDCQDESMDATGVSVNFLMGFENTPDQVAVKRLSDVKITFVKACRCLRKSEDSVRKLMMAGCEFGRAIPGTGGKLNDIFFPGKFREFVGPERFDTFLGVNV